MTLWELMTVVQDQNYRLLVYNQNDEYVETITYSKYQSMFRLKKKDYEYASGRLDEILNAPNVVKFVRSAEYYPDIGVQLL